MNYYHILINPCEQIYSVCKILGSTLNKDFADYVVYFQNTEINTAQQIQALLIENECTLVQINTTIHEKCINIIDVLVPTCEKFNSKKECGNNGQPTLWAFLLELLLDKKESRDLIAWKSDNGQFELLNPEIRKLLNLKTESPYVFSLNKYMKTQSK